MSQYTDLKSWVEPGPRRGIFVTTRYVVWDIGRKKSGFTYHVPPGFVFDVTIPRWAAWLFNPEDRRFLKAACLHDHMLIDGWDRTTAAGIFNDALRADGVTRLERVIMFLAVSLFKWR